MLASLRKDFAFSAGHLRVVARSGARVENLLVELVTSLTIIWTTITGKSSPKSQSRVGLLQWGFCLQWASNSKPHFPCPMKTPRYSVPAKKALELCTKISPSFLTPINSGFRPKPLYLLPVSELPFLMHLRVQSWIYFSLPGELPLRVSAKKTLVKYSFQGII